MFPNVIMLPISSALVSDGSGVGPGIASGIGSGAASGVDSGVDGGAGSGVDCGVLSPHADITSIHPANKHKTSNFFICVPPNNG